MILTFNTIVFWSVCLKNHIRSYDIRWETGGVVRIILPKIAFRFFANRPLFAPFESNLTPLFAKIIIFPDFGTFFAVLKQFWTRSYGTKTYKMSGKDPEISSYDRILERMVQKTHMIVRRMAQRSKIAQEQQKVLKLQLNLQRRFRQQ